MLRHLDLFSGIGGFTLAAKQLGGIQTTQFVEINTDAQRVLRSHFPDIPIHSDIRDYHPEPGEFEIITMGFPCTGTSNAGSKTGLSHPASSLWREGFRVLLEAQPKFCIMEQPEGVIRRGLRTILASLYMAGYQSEVETVSAGELGAGHQRFRLFIISYSDEWANFYKMRPAGQVKCEKWFKDKGLIPSGYQLGTRAIALMMGFPSNWFEVLSQKNSKNLTTQNQAKPQEESEQDISQVEQLPQDKQPLPSVEFSISIPCLIKQPHKKPFEGLIVGDRGSEFDVQVGDRVIQLPKLYVFPNPPKRVKCRTDDDISLVKFLREGRKVRVAVQSTGELSRRTGKTISRLTIITKSGRRETARLNHLFMFQENA